MKIEVITFTTPKVQVEEETDEIEDDLYEEVEINDEDMGRELEEPTLSKMDVDKEDPNENDKKGKQGKEAR